MQPVHSVRSAAFFVGGQREDDVAVRNVAFLLEADQRGDHDGVAVFHVLRAAAVVVAVFLDELKRIGGPVLAACFDHIEMSDEQHRLVLAAAVQTHHQILLAIVGPEDLHVAVGKSGVAKTLRHGFGGGRNIADRIRGVDLDQLFEDVVGELLGGVVDLRLRSNCQK